MASEESKSREMGKKNLKQDGIQQESEESNLRLLTRNEKDSMSFCCVF